MEAHSWNERYRQARANGAGDGLWSAQPHAMLQRLVHPLAAGAALDLATGDGRNAIWLARRGWQVTAVDFSSEGLDIARSRESGQPVHSGTVDWQLGDVTGWEPTRLYHLVTITYLHLDEPATSDVIRRATHWLVPGGTLVVIGHDKDNLAHGTGGPQDPAVLYSASMLRTAAEGTHVLAAERIVRDSATDPEGPHEAGHDAIDTLLHAVNELSA